MSGEENPRLLRSLLPILIILSMIGPLALNIIMPSLPGLATALNASRSEVQLTLSLFLASQAVAQLFIGALADRFGRRPVLLISLGLYLAASLAATFATSILWLILARIIQAIGSTAGIALSRTVVKDLAPRDLAASMIGYVTSGMVVAPLMAPILGGIIDDHYGWRAIFVVCLLLGGVALVLTAWKMPETRPASIEDQSIKDVLARSVVVVRNRRFMGYALGAAFTSAVFFAFLGAAPYLVVETLQLSKLSYGLWFTCLSFGYLIGNFSAGRLSVRLGGDKMIFMGNVIGFSGAILLLVLALIPVLSPAALFIPCFITSLGNGLLLPNAVAGAVSVDAKATGTAAGVVGFLQMGIGAIASYLSGWLTVGTALPTALLMCAMALAGWLAIWWGQQAKEFTPPVEATHPH